MARPSSRIQAQAGLAGPSRLQVQDNLGFGGAAVVNFWAGKLCFLSLNAVVFLCVFLWLVVLFVVLIFVVKSSGKLCTFCAFFVDEVVRFVVLIFVVKSSGKLCTFCAFFVGEVVVGAKYKLN